MKDNIKTDESAFTPGRLSAEMNVFDQMHKLQAFQWHPFQPFSELYHEQPVAQQEQLHLLFPVSPHHLFLKQQRNY